MSKATQIAFTVLFAVAACGGDRVEYITSQGAFATACDTDAGSDASMESGATAEASVDAALESSVEAGPADASDASDDSSSDAALDAVADSSADSSSPDTGSDASSSDSGSPPYIRQAGQFVAHADNPAVDPVTLTLPVLSGSTIVVFAYNMEWGTLLPITIKDTQLGTYTYVTTALIDSDVEASEQAWYRTNVAAGTLKVTATYGGGSNQWHAVVVAEIANVQGMTVTPSTGNYTWAAGPRGAPPTTADYLTSGTFSLGSSPGFIVGFGDNGCDYGAALGYPAAGTGFTKFGTYMNWAKFEGTSNFDSATLESAYFPSGGNHAATFTNRGGGENAFFIFGFSFQ